jgi:hypothetical protein
LTRSPSVEYTVKTPAILEAYRPGLTLATSLCDVSEIDRSALPLPAGSDADAAPLQPEVDAGVLNEAATLTRRSSDEA